MSAGPRAYAGRCGDFRNRSVAAALLTRVDAGAGAEQHHHDAQGHGVVYAERAERHESVPEPDAVRGVPQARQLDDRLQLLRVEARARTARERSDESSANAARL